MKYIVVGDMHLKDPGRFNDLTEKRYYDERWDRLDKLINYYDYSEIDFIVFIGDLCDDAESVTRVFEAIRKCKKPVVPIIGDSEYDYGCAEKFIDAYLDYFSDRETIQKFSDRKLTLTVAPYAYSDRLIDLEVIKDGMHCLFLHGAAPTTLDGPNYSNRGVFHSLTKGWLLGRVSLAADEKKTPKFLFWRSKKPISVKKNVTLFTHVPMTVISDKYGFIDTDRIFLEKLCETYKSTIKCGFHGHFHVTLRYLLSWVSYLFPNWSTKYFNLFLPTYLIECFYNLRHSPEDIDYAASKIKSKKLDWICEAMGYGTDGKKTFDKILRILDGSIIHCEYLSLYEVKVFQNCVNLGMHIKNRLFPY